MIGTIFYCAAVLLFAAHWVFGRFSYELRDQCVVARRRVFHVIPFGTRRIPFTAIKDIRRFGQRGDWIAGADVFGNLFWRPAALIILKRGLCRRIYITPQDVDGFVRSVQAELSAEDDGAPIDGAVS